LWVIGMVVAFLTTVLLIVNLRPEIWKGLLGERNLTLIAIGVSVTAFIVLLAIGGAASRWTGFQGKTVWDLLQLLIVPLALVVIGFLFSVQQEARQQQIENQRAKAERELAEERAQGEALQDYLDKMGSLLLEKDLRASEENSEVRTLARARTLTVLERLDPNRKTAVMEFLMEAELVQSVDGGRGPIMPLTGANLSGADLNDANLLNADLSTANLRDANLSDANLSRADLSDANLPKADLSKAELSDADLSKAELSAADLSFADLRDAALSKADLFDANLSFADLSDASLRAADLRDASLFAADGVTKERLEQQSVALASTTMPNGTKTSIPAPANSNLLFSSHFTHTSSAWPQVREEDAGNYNDDGGYRIYAPASQGRAVSPLGAGPYQDVAVEVDAKVLNSQTDEIASGVVCRRQDVDNYYGMVVFGDGYVSILRIKDANLIQIEGDDRSELIGENVGSPHIRGECVGNTLTLYVNHKKVLEAEDSAFKSGGVGLIVYSGNPDAGADVQFDNFFVKKP
jgi:uncharacterized protein YjbI with pentapeptide repeats